MFKTFVSLLYGRASYVFIQGRHFVSKNTCRILRQTLNNFVQIHSGCAVDFFTSDKTVANYTGCVIS